MKLFSTAPYKKVLGLISFCFCFCISNAQLTAKFSADRLSGCAPLTVNFKDESTGGPTSWEWTLGDGTTSKVQNPSIFYLNPGQYSITLEVKNATGTAVETKTKYITVYAAPKIEFFRSAATGCYPFEVTFTDNSKPGDGTITKWFWDFGDGKTITGTNIEKHTYNSPGTYPVSLQATNSFGCVATKTESAFITINDGVTPDFTISAPSRCTLPVNYTFTNKSTGTGTLSYEWDFDDGTKSTAVNPTHSFTAAKDYTIKLTVRNDKGCSATFTKILKVGVANSTFNAPAVVCVGQAVAFTNTSTPAPVSSAWSFGDGTSSSAISPTKAFTTVGTYTVKLNNDFGSCQGEATRQIEVILPATVDFTADNQNSCKAPFTAKFTSNSPDAVAYEWNFGDGKTSTASNPTHTYTALGEYDVTLTVTNKAGCKTVEEKKKFIVIKTPIVSILNNPGEGCVPLTYKPILRVETVDPIVDYKWTFGDGSTGSGLSPAHTYTSTGKFDVVLTYTTKGGCTGTATGLVFVGDVANVDFSVDLKEFCANQSVKFTDLSTATPPVNRWLWDFGDGTTSDLQNPDHLFNGIDKFDITLTVFSNGCPTKKTIKEMVNVKPPIGKFRMDLCGDRFTKQFWDESIQAKTWFWEFGDGKTSTEQNPKHTYTATGSYSVKLTVTNGACSYTTVPKLVHIIDDNISFSASDDLVCKNTEVTFDLKGIAPANVKKIDWQPTGFSSPFGGITTFKHNFDNTGIYNMAVTVTDINDCPLTFNKDVKVIAPNPNFNVVQPIVCVNTAVQFNDLSTPYEPAYPITKWEMTYEVGKTETVTPPTFSYTYAKGGTYTVSLKVTDSEGCSETVSKNNIIEIPEPIASFSSPNIFSCTTKNIQFENLSIGKDLVYAWTFGDGQTSTTLNPAVTYAGEGEYDIHLKVTDAYGCTDVADSVKYIKVFNPIAKIINPDTYKTCPPLTPTFTNDSKNFIKHDWVFGDGGTSKEMNPQHLYNFAGKYTVTLTVESNGGCTDVATQEIEVKGPTGAFTFVQDKDCATANVKFEGSSKDIVKYSWDFGKGYAQPIPTTDNKVEFNYTIPGIYAPKMILTDPDGCSVGFPGSTITVYGIEASLTADKQLLCDNGNVSFVADAVTNDLIEKYTWTLGDGSVVTNTDKNFVHKYAGTGNYPVQVKVETKHGCTDDATSQVKIVQSPKAKITAPDPACVPALFQFKGDLDNSDTSTVFNWAWDFDNGQKSTLKDPLPVTYTTDGNFVVKLKLTNSSGCSDEIPYTVTVHPLPKTNAGADVIICRDKATTLQATGAQSYTWTTSTSLSCTNCAQPVASPKTNETFILTGTDTYGTLKCSTTDQVVVTVQQPFTVTVSKGDTLCIGEKYGLQAEGADLYQWSPATGLDNPTSPRPIASPSTTTTYTVTGRDRNGCFDYTATVPVTVYPYPKVELGENREVSVGFPVELKPKELSADVTSILWTPATGLSCTTCPNPMASPKQTTPYKIEVQNEGKCIATDFITLFMVCKGENMFLPNTFSPNGDSFNETFYPRGRGLSSVKTFRIYNRWGEVVFESSNFQVNDRSKGWNGMYKGKPAASDVYVYIIEVICENNEIITNKGDVTLLR